MEIDVQTVKAKLDAGEEFLLLDCREQDEWDRIRIEGATFIPMGEVATRVEEISEYKDKPVVVYCRSGRRSEVITNQLTELGFTDVKNMVGGINKWAREIDTTMSPY